MDTVAQAWFSCSHTNGARNISPKLKASRGALRKWSGNRSNLKILINHANLVISFLDDLEEIRPLHLTERNFRNII